MAEPLLDPPCAGWQADLPSPNQSSDVVPSLGTNTPNHLNGIYLEMSRRWLSMRGLISLLAVPLAVYDFWCLRSLYEEWPELDLTVACVSLMFLVLILWLCATFLRVDLSPPRDLPLRFNRARQKIYAYNFLYRWWNPFGRWRVVPVSYDWSQVRAEAWRQRGVTAQGGLIVKWGVVLSIVAPGTNQVIDRFPLSTMGADEHAWAYICTYMQQGPDALPPPGPPRDPDAVPWYNLALRLAPKVRWPQAMDIESRTAPSPSIP